MQCLRILRIEKLKNRAFCIEPPALAGGSFVYRRIKTKTDGFFHLRKPTEYDKINSEKYRKEIETMRKKTDLEAVKETLKLFLYMPIEKTDLSPIIIMVRKTAANLNMYCLNLHI